MTQAELRAELTVLGITGRNLKYEVLGWGDIEAQKLLETVGPTKIVHQEGDREGGGDHSEVVVHFEEHDIYLKATGYYSSYNGTEWNDEMTEVRPQEKVITVYS